jgi:hypothetical protein
LIINEVGAGGDVQTCKMTAYTFTFAFVVTHVLTVLSLFSQMIALGGIVHHYLLTGKGPIELITS